MHHAYIIETGETAAGIVTREKQGFVFHAAEATFRAMDGQLFDSPQKAQRAAEKIRRVRQSRFSGGAPINREGRIGA
jgi:hypothetical protein